VAPGGTTIPNSRDAHRAAMNMHAGTSRPSYLEAGGIWFKTSDGKWYKYDGSTDKELAGALPSGATRPSGLDSDSLWYQSTDKILYFYDGTNDIVIARYGSKSLPLNDTTPSVEGGGSFEEVNTSATTVTTFDDGVKGDKLILLITTSYTTIGSGLTKTGKTIPLIAGDRLEFVHNGTAWKQIAGNVGMGQFVRLAVSSIATWITASTTSYTAVDLTGESVRKGATNALISVRMDKSGGGDKLVAFATSAAGADGRDAFRDTASSSVISDALAPLNSSAVIYVKHWVAVSTSIGRILGYYI